MQDSFTKLKEKITGKSTKQAPQLLTTVATEYEVNLVPDVKIQMLKAQKMRNLVLFICIIVGIASIGVVLVLFSIKSGQDIAMSSQDKRLEKMSAKMNDYGELADLTTIQRQLNKISQLSADKPVLSRVFGALDVVLPKSGDIVQISELSVNLEENILNIEGQADALTAPLIDYRVLESLKKTVSLLKYDYGRFVDAEGNEIPTWCINEADGNGMPYRDGENYYVWWNLSMKGCGAVAKGTKLPDDSTTKLYYNPESDMETEEVGATVGSLDDAELEVDLENDGITVDAEQQNVEQVKQNVKRVKIWRTPPFEIWHKAGYMELNGDISGVEHFVSKCTKYTGTMQGGTGNVAKWASTNDCVLVPEGLDVTSSTNGRDESNNLVLKFSANMQFESGFFAFQNKHMIAIGPVGQNVTDSFVQIGGMFAQEARDCAKGDTECLTTVKTDDEDDAEDNKNDNKGNE